MMKLMVPVAGMVVAAGSCCCCGGDLEDMIEDLQREAGGGSASVDMDGDDGDATADAASGSGDATASAPAASGNTEGLCGRFKDDGLTVPSGLSVMSCATMGTTEAVVMQGSGDPKAACVPIKDWATSHGWNVTTEASIVGTTSIILKNGDKQLTVACTDQTGQTTVSISISQGY